MTSAACRAVIRPGAGGEDQGDDLVDDRHVRVAGDDRDHHRVAGGYLGVLTGEVSGAGSAGSPSLAPEPGVL